jgi:hypothetical protein
MSEDLRTRVVQWLDMDIEDCLAEADRESPASQSALLKFLLETAIKDPNHALREMQFEAAKSLLAGVTPLLNEREAVRGLCDIVNFASRATDEHELRQVLVIGTLLLGRIRDGIVGIGDDTLAQLQTIATTHGKDESHQSSSLLRRIQSLRMSVTTARSASRPAFDLPDLDIKQAADNVKHDARGDWLRDPWNWPEIAQIGSRGARLVLSRLTREPRGWTVPISVAKQGGGTRPAIIVNPVDRIGYQSLVDELSLTLLADVPDWVYGWRLSRTQPTKGVYAGNGVEWRSYRHCVVERCGEFKYAARIDIEAFFQSVNTSALISQVGRRWRESAVLDRLESYFVSWSSVPHGRGLTQRSLASSVLAQYVLRPIDAFLDRLSSEPGSRFSTVRWMDDIWLFSTEETRLLGVIKEVEFLLGQVGLGLNPEKTRLFRTGGKDDPWELLDDSSGDIDDNEAGVLSEVEDILSGAEGAPTRSDLAYAANRSVMLNQFDALTAFVKARNDIESLTYGADYLSKALKVSGEWRRYTDWYTDYTDRHVANDNWGAAAWGEMFPDQYQREFSQVASLFGDRLTRMLQRVLIPLAAHKLSLWRHDAELLLAAARVWTSDTNDFEVRSALLGAIDCGARRPELGPLINELSSEDLRFCVENYLEAKT